MITDDERFIEIQEILAFSDVHPTDCIKINDLIIELSKQNTELKEKLLKLEDKYIHNVPCCNEEDCELYKKYKQSKDNWNKLKEWLEDENNQQYSKYIYNYSINNWVLNKMQEIEKGGMNE